MAEGQFLREQLEPKHILHNFDSGVIELDDWLTESALKSDERDYGRTYIWHVGDNQVVAFFTLSAHVINSDQLPLKQARGQQRIIPTILLGKFALDKTLQGKNLGEVLLADAMDEAVKASKIAAARYLVVDAISDELIGFYKKYGFTLALGSNEVRPRLFIRLKDLKLNLGL